jgi:hypothetical protein
MKWALGVVVVMGLMFAGCANGEETVRVKTTPISNVGGVPDPKPEIKAVEEHQAAVLAFYTEVARQDFIRAAEQAESDRIAAEAAAEKKKQTTTKKTTKPKSHSGTPTPSSGAAQCVINHESATSGTYSAENPTSTASGAYQFVDGTWDNYGGYHHASDAPPEVQDRKFAEVWANGAGRSHWNGSGC